MTEGLFFVVMVLSLFIYLYLSKAKKYETMLRIAELGDSANEELLAAFGRTKGNYKTDYKIGLIWLAIGVPTSLSLLLREGLSGALLGSILIFVGIAYIVSGKYRWREDD
tara:strand:- start:236 stop:565 length:330 start_codon:yes stop_codon:yes gene_type:complete